MADDTLQKTALAVAGLTALGISGAILLAPHHFYATYGFTLPNSASLLSELRAPAANLLALGVLILAGLFRSALIPISSAVALTVFIAYPFGRIVSLALDGIPSAYVLVALGIEIAIGVLCLAAFRPQNAY